MHIDPPSQLTSAELATATPVVAMAAAIGAAYVADRLGFGVSPGIAAAAALLSASTLLAALRRRVRWQTADTLALLLVVASTLTYLLWLAWPALLPLGSGSDLTHHLQLVDYIERQGRLPHDASTVEFLGEMAAYTPGLHLLTAIAGRLTAGGWHALYPVVAVTVALKFGVFLLVLLRLFRLSPFRLPLAVAGTIAVLTVPTYSLGSFVDDSFLAQVASELFAVFAWWALVVWDDDPDRVAMMLFATAGVAIFLTWPIWIGPPVLTLALLILTRRALSIRTRLAHASIALLPVALAAAIHASGRAEQAFIVSASGAVIAPSLAVAGWALPLLSLAGFVLAATLRRHLTAVFFTVAIAAQAAGLWMVAAGQTPYMAIKMTYLAVYPAIACAAVLLDAIGSRVIASRTTLVARRVSLATAWIAVVALGLVVSADLPRRSRVRPVVSADLAAAGMWARARLPVNCVDYLVGNDYTAYWLHLAVLGNPRISSRTGDDDTFGTQASMARWLVPGSPRYALANLRILPDEIRNDVIVLQQFGDVAVVERRVPSTCPP